MKDPSFSYCYLRVAPINISLQAAVKRRGPSEAELGAVIKQQLVHSLVSAFVKRDSDQKQAGAH